MFACGTKKAHGENCGTDPIRNCIYTILVASCDVRGKVTTFSERCSGIMVTTYSGNGLPFGHNVVRSEIILERDFCDINYKPVFLRPPNGDEISKIMAQISP